jgi:DNA-binding transcriptional LysR family regulator
MIGSGRNLPQRYCPPGVAGAFRVLPVGCFEHRPGDGKHPAPEGDQWIPEGEQGKGPGIALCNTGRPIPEIQREPGYTSISEDRLCAINLNLLPILRELLRYRKVSQAAKALNMSQSAVSDALARLRYIFQDELLVSSGRVVTLTEKARQIEVITLEALDKFEALLGTKTFDPRDATGKIQIAAPDTMVLSLGMRMVQRIRADGARVSLHFHVARDSSIQALSSGMTDFALGYGYKAPPLPGTLKATYLFDDRLVLVAGRQFRSFDELDQTHLEEIRQFMRPGGPNTKEMFLDEMFLQHTTGAGLQTIVLPPLRLLPLIAQSPNTLGVVPGRLAQQLAQDGRFRVREFALPDISAFAVWNQARACDALHQWMLRIVLELGVAISADFKCPRSDTAHERDAAHEKG